MRVAVAWIWHETKCFPECSSGGGAGVDRHLASQRAGTLKQRDGQLTSDTEAPKRGSNIEAPHAQCARYGGVDGHSSDPSQCASNVSHQQCFSFASEALSIRHPLDHEPLQKTVTLASRLSL